jgi:hypothetical protein
MADPLPIAAVHVEIAPKRFRTVNSIAEAADMLLHGWPKEGRGEDYHAAVRSCLAALRGEARKGSARTTFIRAAREAGLYIRTEEPR